MHLIQGFFIQERPILGIGYSPGIGERVFFEEDAIMIMFSGFLVRGGEDGTGPLQGQMDDKFGVSELSDVTMGPDILSFKKQYLDPQGKPVRAPIRYVLRPQLCTWVGTYSVPTGMGYVEGPARCIINEANLSLFQADLMEFIQSRARA